MSCLERFFTFFGVKILLQDEVPLLHVNLKQRVMKCTRERLVRVRVELHTKGSYKNYRVLTPSCDDDAAAAAD